MNAKDRKALQRLLQRLPRDLQLRSIDALHGFFFVTAACPEMIMPSDWLGYLLGDEDSDEGVIFDTDAEAQATLRALMGLYNDALVEAGHRADGYPSGCPIQRPAYRNAEPEAPLSQWCIGAVRALEWLWDAWDALGPNTDPARSLLAVLCAFATPQALANVAQGTGVSSEEAAEGVLRDWPTLRKHFVTLSRAAAADAPPAPPLPQPAKIGRNEPCPCGSGKKYKKCCLGQEAPLEPSGGIGGELEQALQEREFASLEEAQAFAADFAQQRNAAPAPGFDGLSPNQMAELLYRPFEASFVSFPERLELPPQAPVVTLFGLLAEALGETGLKTTATGNLPREFCRRAALVFLGEAGLEERTRFGGINKEADFDELHVTRLVAQQAGLIRKYKGRWVLTRAARQLLADSGMAGIYPRLLRAFAHGFNWAYQDRYPQLHIIQRSFAFTLYLLSRHGDTPRPQAFYEDAFLAAYPAALAETEPSAWDSAEDQLRRCYTLRTLVRFAAPLGLIDLEPAHADRTARTSYTVSKRPLLDAAVRFSVG
jgi:yecA family protein